MKTIPINAPDHEMMNDMKEIAAQKVREWFGSGAVFDSSAPMLRQYPNSFMIRFGVQTPRGDEAVLVKIPSKPYFNNLQDAINSDISKTRAEEQYVATIAVWNAINEEGDLSCFAIPAPVQIKKWNALVMQEIKGKMLKTYLLKPSIFLGSASDWENLIEAISHSAKWLRIVHSRAGKIRNEPFPVEGVQALIDETLEKLEKDSDGQVDVKFYQGVLQKHLKVVSRSHVPVGLLHDDFHYSNILITPEGRACALDYAFTNYGPIYTDISTMLIDPETRLVQILSLNKFLSKGRLVQLRSVFLDNYFQGQPYDEQVLKFYCAVAVLYKWSVDERRFSNNGHRQFYSPMLRSVIRRHFQDVFKSYLN